MRERFFLLGDVSRLLQTPPYRIAYLLATCKVPEPALRLGNKRVFTDQDINRIAERLKRPVTPEEVAHG
jgi:hypothetical protein